MRTLLIALTLMLTSCITESPNYSEYDVDVVITRGAGGWIRILYSTTYVGEHYGKDLAAFCSQLEERKLTYVIIKR